MSELDNLIKLKDLELSDLLKVMTDESIKFIISEWNA